MKTTQPALALKETAALLNVLRNVRKAAVNPSFTIETLPLDRKFLGKDLALEVFEAVPTSKPRGTKVYHDMVTRSGEKVMVIVRGLVHIKARNSYVATSGISLYPLKFLKEGIPDFVSLVVVNEFRKTVDIFKFPVHLDDGTVRESVSVSFSKMRGNYGKNEKFLFRSISPQRLSTSTR